MLSMLGILSAIWLFGSNKQKFVTPELFTDNPKNILVVIRGSFTGGAHAPIECLAPSIPPPSICAGT